MFVKKTVLGLCAALTPVALGAQSLEGTNTDYGRLKTSTYVHDPVNNLTSLASIISCVVRKSGVGLSETLGKTWRATVPEAECVSSSWPGIIEVVANTQRVSNDSSQDTLMWIDIETSKKRYVLSMNSWSSAEDVAPYGIFDMKFYKVENDAEVPTTADDMARIYTEIEGDNVVLTSARNNRGDGSYSLAKVEYTDGASNFRFVAKNEIYEGIGVASSEYFYSSLANGVGKTCKSRENAYSNAWNSRLFDAATGEEIELENGTISIEFVDENSDPIEYGTGFVSPAHFYFRNRIRGMASNRSFDAVDRLTDEPIELIWSPARFFDIKQKAITLEIGDKFFSRYEVEYDGIGLKYTDQTIDPVSCDCGIEVVGGVKYLKIHENGRRFWHRPFNNEILFLPKNPGTNNYHEIEDTAYVGVRIPVEASSSLLTSTTPTPLVCVSDWSCPHVVDDNTTIFGQTDLSVFHDVNGIAITNDNRKTYFNPRTTGNDPLVIQRHNYLLTPLDVTGLPAGTFPATLYYDTNGNQVLDASEKPIMTHFINKLRFMDADGNTYEDDKWYNGATGLEIAAEHDNDALGLSVSLVTLADYENGCDGIAENGEDMDTSFAACPTKFRYETGPNAWGSNYYVKKGGNFVNQESPSAVIYKALLQNDLNAGVNERIVAAGGDPAGRWYRLDGNASVSNEFSRRDCTADCFQEAGPEAIEDMEMILTHDGREFYPLPGDYVSIPGEANDQWFSAMSLDSGTVVQDLFDDTKQYVVKNVAVSQRLGLVPNAVCEDPARNLAYTDITDPAFSSLQLSDLPPLDFDADLLGMPTWNQMPGENEINSGCYVNNGNVIGVCAAQ